MRTIYYNGVVYTGELPLAEAFVVEGDRFIFAGSNRECEKLAEDHSVLVNLEGRFVCSGFNDSHMHLLGFGDALQTAQLAKHTDSLADLLGCLRDFKCQRQGGWTKNAWLVGRGWNQDYFTDVDRMPNRFDLDQVSTEIPICAVRACGHCLVVNSRALEILGVTAGFPQPDRESLKNRIRSACNALNAYGITSCQTDDYCAFCNVPWQEVNAAYKELEKSGELTVRVYEQSNFTDLESLKQFVEAGNKTGVGSDLFKIGPLKMLGDGALGARTAYLSQPYADDPSTCGILVFSQKMMDEMIGYANEQGIQVAVHAIGDACLDRVLSAYEKALERHPRKDHRHGIVHCQITRPDQAFTVQEALDSYTIRSAEGSFEENCKGRIAPGMLADFVVLEENPFEVDVNAIKDISVRATYLGGKKVFEAVSKL